MRRRSGVAFEAYVTATPSDDQIWWAIVDVTAQQQAEENVWTLQREIDSRVATQLGEIHAVYEDCTSVSPSSMRRHGGCAV